MPGTGQNGLREPGGKDAPRTAEGEDQTVGPELDFDFGPIVGAAGRSLKGQ